MKTNSTYPNIARVLEKLSANYGLDLDIVYRLKGGGRQGKALSEYENNECKLNELEEKIKKIANWIGGVDTTPTSDDDDDVEFYDALDEL